VRYLPLVISDALTARVVGLTMILFVLLIDASMVLFSRAPGTPVFPFALYASLPSVPFILLGTFLIVRARRFDKT
jgi:hypothetical protein